MAALQEQVQLMEETGAASREPSPKRRRVVRPDAAENNLSNSEIPRASSSSTLAVTITQEEEVRLFQTCCSEICYF